MEDEKFEYILTNPPYFTSASGNIKNKIESPPKTKSLYPADAMGLQDLSVEWTVNSLKAKAGIANSIKILSFNFRARAAVSGINFCFIKDLYYMHNVL